MDIKQAVPAKDTSKARQAAAEVFARRRAQRAIDELTTQGYEVTVTGPGAEKLHCY